MTGQRIGYIRVSTFDQNPERQLEGVKVDRAFSDKQRGAYRGRKKSLSSERIAELRQRVEAGEQKTKLAREFGISRETLYQYLRTDQ